jgi:hypothetical protein
LKRSASRLTANQDALSKMTQMKPDEEEALLNISGKGSSDTESLKTDKWNDDRFIWHEHELEIVNDKRRK